MATAASGLSFSSSIGRAPNQDSSASSTRVARDRRREESAVEQHGIRPRHAPSGGTAGPREKPREMPRDRRFGLVRQARARAGRPAIARRHDRRRAVSGRNPSVRRRARLPRGSARRHPAGDHAPAAPRIVMAIRSAARRRTADAPSRRCTSAAGSDAGSGSACADRRRASVRPAPPARDRGCRRRAAGARRWRSARTRSSPSSIERANQAEVGRAAADVADEHQRAVAETALRQRRR